MIEPRLSSADIVLSDGINDVVVGDSALLEVFLISNLAFFISLTQTSSHFTRTMN